MYLSVEDTHDIYCLLFPSEEPEEEVTLEDLEERAKSGDARAQSKVSQHIANTIDFNDHMVGTGRISQLTMNSILRGTSTGRTGHKVNRVTVMLKCGSSVCPDGALLPGAGGRKRRGAEQLHGGHLAGAGR